MDFKLDLKLYLPSYHRMKIEIDALMGLLACVNTHFMAPGRQGTNLE